MVFDHSNHFYGLNRPRSRLKRRPSEKLHSSLTTPG